MICDLAGLVNGAAAAALTPERRLSRCAAEHPGFAFVNAGQAASLLPYVDFTRGCYELKTQTIENKAVAAI
jgi:hypothetical protein